ncbi:MAG: uracil-DNA glycosylase [Calditrichaceae bacterium]|nr:uracil-DNA glycosylase [Calditrichaceae bacterium]MBN2709922.1 uracil-DNA glycosylase [Calditrichaceae bacterium]RQV92674.1 MAG: uracil-DNA glycosylase [Calditrichota bacterium]
MDKFINELEDYFNWYKDIYGNTLYTSDVVDPDYHINISAGVSEAQESPAYTVASQDFSELDAFREQIKNCTRCHLSRTRKNFVFGLGNPKSELMFIGEAPGAEEDATGIPFVGRAGKLLDKMLYAIGLKREEIYIANVLKCRPPNNRDPQPDEIAQCEPYLIEQIRIISPKILVALGRVSGQMLSGQNKSLGILRSGDYTYNNLPLIITYHPAALLRNPSWKANAWIDLKKIKKMLNKD